MAQPGYSQRNSFKPKYEVILKAKYGEQLSSQCSRDFPGNVDSFFSPTKVQVARLLQHFKSVVKLGLGESPNLLKKYGYQYIGVVINDTPFIYVNAFITDSINLKSGWEEYPFMACDGGNRYWGVLFCLKTRRFSQLAINGGYYH
ncbi:MAG TPA: hypothetical protein VER36_11340 [Flavisolibacter sp.]|nr:hypothetical protein [Flavisolibacter sp.]